jgi:hypothetical protein
MPTSSKCTNNVIAMECISQRSYKVKIRKFKRKLEAAECAEIMEYPGSKDYKFILRTVDLT